MRNTAIRSAWAAFFSIGISSFLLTTVLWAQKPENKPEMSAEQKATQERLDFMFNSCAEYSGTRKSDGAKIKIFPKPLLRWTNPNFGVRDGLFVVWVDQKNRPMAAGQVFLMPRTDNRWYIEQQSLCDGAITLQSASNSVWAPTEPGVKWKAFPDKGEEGVEPSDNKRLRLTQMRSLARRFRGQDDLVDEDDELRLMPNPMVRYDDAENQILDGALFALVQGTDPELLVQIEAREIQSGRKEYLWAIAPMTSASADAYLDDNMVYSKANSQGSQSSEFYMRQLSGGVPFPEGGPALER